ncbi:protein kinase [Lentinula edodes]|uniref:Protein kinase n=1 Tax=Lentinula edodes TaxID=5353 RepID=A0A1Q3EKI5_LENED|nr:protein kinase [Lentinula edodes]
MEAPPETKLATPTSLPQQKQPDAPPIVGSTPESNGAAHPTQDDAPQRTSALSKFLEDDVHERVVFSLDEFVTLILDLPTDWKIKEEFSLPPTSTAVKEALGAYLKVAIKIAEGERKKWRNAATNEIELNQPLTKVLNTLRDGEGHFTKDNDGGIFCIEDPHLVLGSLLERNGIYSPLLKLTENKKLSTYLADKNIFGVFWGLLLLFVEVNLRKKGFADPNIQRADVQTVKVKHPDPLLNMHLDQLPAVEIQSDASTPLPSTPSTPTITSLKQKDRPRVTIQSTNRTKTVEIATLREARAEGMSRAEQNVIQTQGQHPTRKCVTEMISTESMNHGFSFAQYRGSEVESEPNDEWTKLVLAMICQLKKLPTEKLVFVPTLVLNGFDYLRDPEQFLQEFADDPQDLIDAVYSFKEIDGRTRQVIVKSILYHAKDFVGLHSLIVDVECLCTKTGCKWHGNEKKVMKISFMGTARQSEQGLIGEARSKAESTGELWALNHLPNAIHSLSLLPNRRKASHRRLKKTLKEKYEEQAMHVTVLEQLHPLSELEDPRDFAQVFYDVLQIHQWLYECGGILHRDLSSGNIMFRRKDGKIYGVLNDFDLSSRVEDVDNGDIRTGTRPFMSLDLLNSYWEGGHLYRHDLESLFYIILCLACRYEAPGVPAPEPRAYSKWFSGSDQDILGNKNTFLTSPFLLAQDLPIQPYFAHFVPWLKRIRYFISEGYHARPRPQLEPVDDTDILDLPEDMQPQASFNWQTLGGQVTYSRFRRVMSSFKDEPLETRWSDGQAPR